MTNVRGIISVLCGSAVSIPLKSGVCRLTVTSPPYHNAIDYKKHIAKNSWYRGNVGESLEYYLSQMEQAFAEVYRVTMESGFCCIIIGNEISDGTLIPLPHIIIERLCKPRGLWDFQEEIIWNKVTGGLDRFGVTIQRPYPTYYRANVMHEHILVLRKGHLTHQKHTLSKLVLDEVMKKDISNSVWNIAPVPPRYIDHPCPFPEEIPQRLVMLYSNKGEFVLDPFSGSGQTGKAAKSSGRNFVGIEIEKEYTRLSKTRIETEKPHVRPQLIAKWEKISK